uniref:Thioredoxin n=1 Tax=Pinctada fucata TaxID=50426 RepID=A0A194AK15_PINFU
MVTLVKTKEEFDGKLKEKPLALVDFYADWCGPCRMIAPKIEEFAKEFTNVTFLKVNVDESSEISEEYEISAMPTFKLFREGKVVKEVVGASEAKIKEALEELVA